MLSIYSRVLLTSFWFKLLLMMIATEIIISLIHIQKLNYAIMGNDELSIHRVHRLLNVIRLSIPVILSAIMLYSIHFIFGNIHLSWEQIVIIGMGLIFTYISILFRNKNEYTSIYYTANTKGEVVEIKKTTDLDHKSSYIPVYRYNVDNKVYVCNSKFSSGSRRSLPEIGEYIDIYYNPKSPSEMQSEFDKKIRKRLICCFELFGYVMILIGFSLRMGLLF